ncbi:MAG: RNA-binding protein [Oscillospiraceae bacterium]|nr:RNA-binding protein [Oscillospiraceae bacterium]
MKSKASFLAACGLSNEDKLLVARIDDMIRAVEKSFSPKFSGFLAVGEAALAERFLEYMGLRSGNEYLFWGGFEGAERVILGLFPGIFPDTFPENFSEESERRQQFPLRIVKFGGRMTGTLSHRDYLGAVMSLGIERSLTGDIICREECAYAVLSPAAAELAVNGITKIGRVGVKCAYSPSEDKIERNDSFKEINCTVPSMRLDCIISEAVGVSRSKAAGLIRSGAVSVNHRAAESVSENVNEGDVLSVRGCGRFILAETDGRTKKDRLKIVIKKYL